MPVHITTRAGSTQDAVTPCLVQDWGQLEQVRGRQDWRGGVVERVGEVWWRGEQLGGGMAWHNKALSCSTDQFDQQ